MEGIADKARRAILEKCAWARFCDIQIEVKANGCGNFILLTGRLGSYVQKQMTQEAVRKICLDEGVQVSNQIAVVE